MKLQSLYNIEKDIGFVGQVLKSVVCDIRSLILLSFFLFLPFFAIVLTAAFPDWPRDGIIYNILVDRFANGNISNDTGTDGYGGDFQGIINYLKNNYFQKLDVNVIYLSPVFPVGGIGYLGFDPADFYGIRDAFGGEKKFHELMDLVHENKMKLMIDMIPGHVSINSDIFRQHKNDGWFGINSSDTPLWNGWGNIPIDHSNAAVTQYIIDVSRYWAAYGVDGMRQDQAQFWYEHQYKISRGISFDPAGWWYNFNSKLEPDYPNFFNWGEVSVNDAAMDAYYLDFQDKLDGLTNYTLLDDVLLNYFVKRTVGTSGFNDEIIFENGADGQSGEYKTADVVCFLDNHDRERFLSYAKGDIPAVRPAVLFQFTHSNIPMIYNGDEKGIMATRDFYFDTFPANQDIYKIYRQAAFLRNELTALRRGKRYSIFKSDGDVYAYFREGTPNVLVATNISKTNDWSVNIDVGQFGIKDGTVFHNYWIDSAGNINYFSKTVSSGLLSGVTVPAENGIVMVDQNLGTIVSFSGKIIDYQIDAAPESSFIKIGNHIRMVDSSGTFTFDRLFSNEKYNVQIWADGYDTMNIQGFSLPDSGIQTFYFNASATNKLKSDINSDGVVDGQDLMLLAVSFGNTISEKGYNRLADIDGNGVVDGLDLMLLARDFGRHS